MCSAVCQQSHSRLPARTDQSRSVRGSRPLMMHEIAASRSPAVTGMMLRAYGHGRSDMTEFLSNDADSDLLTRTVRSAAVLVVTANPELGVALGRFGAAPGDEIEELVGAVDRVDATGIRRVGVEHLPWPVLDKSTKSFPVLESSGAGAVVVDRLAAGYLVWREGGAEVVVEVRPAGGIPGERPAHPLLVGR